METRQVVTELLARIAEGDPDRIAALYAEHVGGKLDWPDGDDTVPWIPAPGTRDGVAEHVRLIAEHHVPVDSSAEVGSVLVDGADAVVLGELRHTAKATGHSHISAFAMHLTVENGLITRHHISEDSLAAAQAFGVVEP